MNNIPSEWKKIDESNYDRIGLVDNKFIKCIASYAINDNDKISVLNFFDYSKCEEDFLEELGRYYDEINEMNEIIDGDPSDEDYECTAILSSLYHGYINESRGLYYLSICKALVDENVYSYDVQLFNKGNKGFYCFEISVASLDESDLIESVGTLPYFKNALSCLEDIAGKN